MDILISNLLLESIFPFDHFPKSKIDSESRFEMRLSILLFYFFVKRFCQYLKQSKNGFPIVFSKSDVALAGGNCGDLWDIVLNPYKATKY